MAAGEFENLLSLLEAAVAYRTQLGLLIFAGLSDCELTVLLLCESFWYFSHFFLKLKQLLVGHVVDVNVPAALVVHVHQHVPQTLYIHLTLL